MKNFCTKLYVFFVYLIIFLPFCHFFSEYRMFMKPVFVFIVGFAGLFMVLKRENFNGTVFTNIVLLLGGLWFVLLYHFALGNVFSYFFMLALFLLFKVFYSFMLGKNSIKNKVIIVVYSIMIGIEIVLVFLAKNFQFLRFYPNESIFSILFLVL